MLPVANKERLVGLAVMLLLAVAGCRQQAAAPKTSDQAGSHTRPADAIDKAATLAEVTLEVTGLT